MFRCLVTRYLSSIVAMGGVIRMVKLFGWEARMSERIDRKRQDELKIIRKFKFLSLISNNVKYVGKPPPRFTF